MRDPSALPLPIQGIVELLEISLARIMMRRDDWGEVPVKGSAAHTKQGALPRPNDERRSERSVNVKLLRGPGGPADGPPRRTRRPDPQLEREL
jgi:hypothetical protein